MKKYFLLLAISSPAFAFDFTGCLEGSGVQRDSDGAPLARCTTRVEAKITATDFTFNQITDCGEMSLPNISLRNLIVEDGKIYKTFNVAKVIGTLEADYAEFSSQFSFAGDETGRTRLTALQNGNFDLVQVYTKTSGTGYPVVRSLEADLHVCTH